MTRGWRDAWDLAAAIAALIALIMLILYVGVMRQQGDQPVIWFLSGLAGAVLLAGYGAAVAAPFRRLALVASGAVLTVLGILSLPSIGLPILGAGVLALVAAARFRGRRQADA